MIADYTYLWYDVRPHPKFGTVEIRVMDSQTRLEHTLALAALVQAMVKELASTSSRARSCRATRTRCSTRTSGWPPGTAWRGSWWTCRSRARAHQRAGAAAGGPAAGHAEDLGSANELAGIEDLLDQGNGASRQIVVYEANHDLREVVGEIVGKTDPSRVERLTDGAARRAASTLGAVSQPDLFVVCKNCGSEVSPYVTECPYCGQRVRKRAPKLDRTARPRRRG